MKKRTAKDFIALYAPEDEEKLVLIQDGVSADKTFLDTYWAAHTHAPRHGGCPDRRGDLRSMLSELAAGRIRSGRPATIPSGFAKGKVYRIMARRWKGDELDEPRWYVTQVLEEGIPCPALEELWAEYTKPVLLEDEVLGDPHAGP